VSIYHKRWVEDYLGNGKIPVMTNGLRALLPAQLIAFLYLTGVGDRSFIERIKSLMGILAIGRKSTTCNK
jgi:hypothetical protein